MQFVPVRSTPLRILLGVIIVLFLASDVAAQSSFVQANDRQQRQLTRPTFSLSVNIPLNRTSSPPAFSSRRSLLELGAAVVTGAGHFAFSAMDATEVYIPLVGLGWGGYIYHRVTSNPDFLSRVGLTRRNLGPAFRDATMVAAGSLALMAGYGALNGSLTLHQDMVPLLLLYPAWGVVQQFLVQGLIARNLPSVSMRMSSPLVVAPATAAAFGAVHLPNRELTAGTTALGLVYTPLYLKHQNVWPLGLYHGWLGVFYYFWVLERNPWKYVVD